MVDVEIEAHADGVGGNQEFDVARLIKRDLGIARARRKGTKDDSRSAALAADQFSEGINLLRREGDDRGAGRQAGDLLFAAIRQLRQARPRNEVGAGDEIVDGVAHRLSAEQQRLGAASGVQQPIGEDVAALGVAAKLDLVDRQEVDIDVARHSLDRRHPVAGALRFDLFFARDQRDLVRADALLDAIVNFAREQTQRQADHAAFVAQHSLDGEVRLTGIGGSEHRRHVSDAGFQITCHMVH